jgi:hypothetical protein
MTGEKICPIMSGEGWSTPCLKEKCMAWKQDGTHGFCKLIGVTE